MKTFIFAGTPDEAKDYQNRNCLFGADMLVSDAPLIATRECEVHLVGTYQRNPMWWAVRYRLEAERRFKGVVVHVEEWCRD